MFILFILSYILIGICSCLYLFYRDDDSLDVSEVFVSLVIGALGGPVLTLVLLFVVLLSCDKVIYKRK